MKINNSKAWYKASKNQVHQEVHSTYGLLKSRQIVQTNDIITALRLYGDNLGVTVTAGGQSKNLISARQGTILNLVKAAADSINAQIARQNPRPVFLTDGANRSTQRRSKQLTRFVEGVFDEQQMKKKAPRAQLDSVLFGTGCLKFVLNNGKICIEQVFPGELFVDAAESIYKEPQNLYQRKFVHKDVLASLYPEYEKQIMMASAPIRDFIGYYENSDLSSMVEVVEAWNLPVDGSPGRHVITISNATLMDEEWHHEDFPFVWIQWTEQRLGFWGRGVTNELLGIQLEINKIVRRIQRAFHMLGVPWIFVEETARVNKALLNNEIGAIIPYTGVPPQVKTHPSIDPQVFQMLEFYWNKGYEITGVSPFLSTGNTPQGLTSGIGVREAVEVQAGRFALHVRSYEDLHLQAAKWIVRLAKEASETDEGFAINAPSKNGKYSIERIKWKDVEMEDSMYTIKVFASSALPQEPSGRLATVLDMLNAGLVEKTEGRQLLDFPDLDRAQSLDQAVSDAIDEMLEKIIDDGVPLVPEPFFDLQLFIKKAQALYANSLVTGQVPPSNLKLLRNAVEAAQAMLRSAMQEQNQQQAQMHAAAAASTPLPSGPSGVQPTALQSSDGNISNQ